MRRNPVLSVGEYYHIYNRGTDKRTIFIDTHDYKRFFALMYICNNRAPVNIVDHFRKGRSFVELFQIEREDQLVDIGAYCLMPNHFHFLIREKTEGGIQKFMTKLSTGYSMYFNKKNERTGALFESRYKVKHADTDEYLKYLFAYIHLNPVKMIDPEWKENGIADRVKAKEFLAKYGFSSYLDYMSDRNREEGVILNKQAFPEYFVDFKEFDEFINEWLDYQNVAIVGEKPIIKGI
jgi:putative transposase